MKIKLFIKKLKWFLRKKHFDARYYLNQKYYNRHKSEYDIKKFKNIYSGQSCFIVGNGPSLLPSDLELIQKKGYVTFAANKIYDIFKSTTWRPTYISVVDPRYILNKETLHEIENIQAKMFFVRSQFARDVRKLNCNVCPINCSASRELLDNPKFSMELENIIYDIATVTYFSIQIAAYMGFKNIFLIGMDNKYAFSMLRDGTIVRNEGVMSYFKESGLQVPSESTAAATWKMDVAYEYAEKYSREHGFRIYNATRGGFLEKFERVSLDELLLGE